VSARLLTTREVADMLAVSPETVLRWYRTGKLPGFPIATNALRFDPDEIREWLEGTRRERTLVSVEARS
jgi:excisionase family DNA binding protein